MTTETKVYADEQAFQDDVEAHFLSGFYIHHRDSGNRVTWSDEKIIGKRPLTQRQLLEEIARERGVELP